MTSRSRQPRPTTHGFTLLELMVTVSILGIIIAISAMALGGLRPKADQSTAASSLATTIQSVRHHARSRNVETWLGIQVPDQPAQPIRYVVVEDAQGQFDPAAQAFGAEPDSGRTVDTGRFPVNVVGAAEADFGSLDIIPEAFRPPAGSLGARGCSFCDANGVGWIVALPRGEIRVWNGDPQRNVEALLIGTRDIRDTAPIPIMVVVSNPFGLVETYRGEP